MEPKTLASLISSLISQTLLSLIFHLLLHPPSSLPTPLPLPLPLLLLHHHFLSTSQLTSSLLPPNPRKRKIQETHHQENQEFAIPRNPDEFKLYFRMSSSSFHYLSGLLDPFLHNPPHLPVPTPTALALSLSRLSLGTPYPALSRLFRLPLPLAISSTKLLCRTLCINFRFHLSSNPNSAFPLPNCRGALATTRFTTGSARSIAVQVVSDADSKISNVAAGFRGGMGDGEVLRRTSIYKECEEGRVLGGGGEYFVGGRGYPLRRWLMVPFDNVGRGTVEEDFNVVHGEMVGAARRAVASLSGWGVMGKLEEEDGRMVVACVGTCAILHNLLLGRGDYSAVVEGWEGDGLEEEEEEEEEECFVEEKACVLRSTLAVKAREVRKNSSF